MSNGKSLCDGVSTGRIRKQLTPIMKEWYGKGDGAGELMKYLPRTEPIGVALQRLAGKILPADRVDFELIRDQWSEIAGTIAARHSTPLSLSSKVLRVEMEHPAYLEGVRSPRVQNAILERISLLIGKGKCTALLFVPAGRRQIPHRRPV